MQGVRAGKLYLRPGLINIRAASQNIRSAAKLHLNRFDGWATEATYSFYGALRKNMGGIQRSVESPSSYVLAASQNFIMAKRIALENRLLENILKQAIKSPRRRGSRVTQYEAPGGFSAANKHFDTITKGCKVVKQNDGLRHAVLPDRRKVVVRPYSQESNPTLEIQILDQPFKTKVRYHDIPKPE